MNKELNALKTLTESNDLGQLGEWKTIDKRTLAYEGKYYPSDIEIQVMNFGIEQVRYFSGLDDTNPSEVSVAMQYLTTKCIRLLHISGKVYDGSHIFDHDRFNLVLQIRAISNVGDSLYTETVCSKCRSKQKSSIVPQTLMYSDITFDSKFDGTVFVLTTPKSEMHYLPLTVHESTMVLDFCKKQLKAGVMPQELATFTKLAPFLRKGNLDFKMDVLYDSYLQLTASQIASLTSASDKAIKALGTIRTICSTCGHSDEAEIEFPSGLKSIVVGETSDDEVFI